jgi:hypothetical protein
MGDYNVLIISAGVKKIDDNAVDEFKTLISEKLPCTSSAYHATAHFISIDNSWSHQTRLSIITQTKWGDGIKEFIEWLTPMVVKGIGSGNVWALEFSEYDPYPIITKLSND